MVARTRRLEQDLKLPQFKRLRAPVNEKGNGKRHLHVVDWLLLLLGWSANPAALS